MPLEFERQIVTGLEEANIIRSIAKTITTSAERKIPVAATHSTAQCTAENGSYTESNPTFDQKTIAAEFARAFGVAEEQAFCVGTGTGQPTWSRITSS